MYENIQYTFLHRTINFLYLMREYCRGAFEININLDHTNEVAASVEQNYFFSSIFIVISRWLLRHHVARVVFAVVCFWTECSTLLGQ